MFKYNSSVVLQFDDDTTGNGGAGLLVTVRDNSTKIKATIYSDDVGTVLDNPLTTGNKGNFGFFIDDGIYDTVINEGLASEFTVSHIQMSEIPILPVADLVKDYGAKGDAVYQREVDGSITVTSGTDDTQALLDAMIDFASGTIGALTVPDGNFWIDSSQIDMPTNTNVLTNRNTTWIQSTTSPNLTTFVGFYQGQRVSNITIGGHFIGSTVKDNAVGGVCIRTFGATNVRIPVASCEGSKGLAWIGDDNVNNLHGSKDVFLGDIRVDQCSLFSVYVRGVETPEVGFDPLDDTNNVNIEYLQVRNSNVALVTAEGNPYNVKVGMYDSQYNDNLLQIEASHHVDIEQCYMANPTNNWPADSPTPYKEQWLISASNDVYVGGHIDAELQAFAFGISGNGCDNVELDVKSSGDFFRVTTLNVQNGVDTNKNLFSNWNIHGNYPRNGTTIFQSDTADQSGFPLAYWRNFRLAGVWTNDSSSNPINSVACTGYLIVEGVFDGKGPRSLKGQNIVFNAKVRSPGIIGSNMLFTAIDGPDPTEDKTLRLGCVIEAESSASDVPLVEDTGFDVVHDSGDYDTRNSALNCRQSDAVEFNDSGATFKRFTGPNGLASDGIGTRKALTVEVFTTIAAENTFITGWAGNSSTQVVVTGANSAINDTAIFIKNRDFTVQWGVFDTLRGVEQIISTDSTAAESTNSGTLTAFGTDSVTVASSSIVNATGDNYISYHFVKSSGFYDELTDVGTGVAKTIPHSLDTDVGCIITKNIDDVVSWGFYYHTFDISSGAYMQLNSSSGILIANNVWNSTEATTTEFTVGNGGTTNGVGKNYIHYLFAKNICQSYSGNGTTNNVIDFGYKPKALIIKRATSATTGNWNAFDTVRDTGSFLETAVALNLNSAETVIAGAITLTNTGIIINTTDSELNAAGSSYILIAIPEV